MKTIPSAIFAACSLSYGIPSAGAAILLIDPGTQTGSVEYTDANAPYAIAGNSTWNQGAGTYTSALFSDGTASGTTTVVSQGNVSGTGTVGINLASPAATGLGGNAVATVFSGNPARNSIYSGASNPETDGALVMRVTDLPAGIYEVYVAAAYLGNNGSDHPGGSSPTKQAIWAFGGAEVDTINYDTSNDTVSGTGIASQSSIEVLENTTAASWVLGNNYAKGTVTLTPGQALYVVASGDRDATSSNNDEYRPWLNLVQIVTIPEPSAALLGALGALVLLRRKR